MTADKIYKCILANIPGRQNRQIKITPRPDSRFRSWEACAARVNEPHAIHGQFIYCNVSFPRQYVNGMGWQNNSCFNNDSNIKIVLKQHLENESYFGKYIRF